ncbi:hypothetical protein DFP73DRAFT_564939 [Morchella snyderi]|nr:hypothetical protein DFP73DRAFT_564939 [Morchella snyderi]
MYIFFLLSILPVVVLQRTGCKPPPITATSFQHAAPAGSGHTGLAGRQERKKEKKKIRVMPCEGMHTHTWIRRDQIKREDMYVSIYE